MKDNEVEETREDLKNKNTMKADKAAHKLLIEYLEEIWAEHVNENYNYWLYDQRLLDKILSKLWFEVRQQNNDRYTVSSLRNLRYAINRNLKKRGAEFDITKSDNFINSQKAFEDACKLLKKLGYGVVKHYDEIIPAGETQNYFLPVKKTRQNGALTDLMKRYLATVCQS